MATRTRRRANGRRQHRKFIWDRHAGTIPTTSFGVDLLAPYRSQPGATHLGATITRIRGFIYPDQVGTTLLGVAGMRVDTWNEDPADSSNQPSVQPDADWLAWMPFFAAEGAVLQPATWNPEASVWAVDIKAQRKLEELNETLWLFVDQPDTLQNTYSYNLSIGLKLP